MRRGCVLRRHNKYYCSKTWLDWLLDVPAQLPGIQTKQTILTTICQFMPVMDHVHVLTCLQSLIVHTPLTTHIKQCSEKFGSKLAHEEHFPSSYHFPISKRLTASAILSPTHACAISQVSVKGGVQSSCFLHGGRACYINAKAQTQSRYYAFRESKMGRSAQRVSWFGAQVIGVS